MNSTKIDHPDAARSRLRTLVAALSHEIDLVASSEASVSPKLRARWSDLVDVLALGDEPEMRACPHCGRIGMRAATRCGFCWQAMTVSPTQTV